MKTIFNLTMLVFALALPNTLNAAYYTVSDAGSIAVNGTYTESDTYNGKPQYRLGVTQYYLRYNDWGPSRWEIWDADMWLTYYYTDDFGDTPPSTGWMQDFGFPPTPTVLTAGPTLLYNTTTFSESSANNGTIDNSITITYIVPGTDYFTGTNGTFAASKYTATNVPTGLSIIITKNSDTELSVSLTGSATNHANANDVSNLQIAFGNTAFNNGNASAVTSATKSDIIVNFVQQYEVSPSGNDYATITAVLNATGTGDIINMAAGTYTITGGNALYASEDITIQGQGAGSTILQAAASYNTASNAVFFSNANLLTIRNMTIRYGKTTGSGGGISCNGNLVLENSTVCDNVAPSGFGGGYFGNGTATITNCLFNHNSANNGGALAGYINITNSTITGNSATYSGGGIHLSTANINNCTITNNTAGAYGPGLYSNFANLTISNTIVADNGTSDYYVAYGMNSFIDSGYNIIKNQTYEGSPVSWKFSASTNILYNYKADGTSSSSWNRNNAALGNQNLNITATLADNNTLNGTQTLALSSGSFAIDAGTGTGADQRGAPVYGTKDIGAYEYNSNWAGWTGNTSTDWAIQGNWNTNIVPTASDDVVIPNVTNDPIISATTSASCNNFTLESGATLTVQSDATNNGSLIVNGTSTGNITYNRYITGVDKWHLVSSPVGAQDINDLVVTNVATNAVAAIDPKYGLAPYNNTTPGWAHYTTGTIGSAGSFTAGKGYEILRTSDGTVAFTGTVATSDVGIGITKNTNGWNLIGNPFPSSINGNSPAHATNNFLTVNSAAIDASYLALYVWNAASSTYLTVNHTYNSGSAFYVAPGQAFFVYSVAGGSTANFTEDMQTHQTGNIFKNAAIPNPSIKLIAERAEGSTSTNILFLESMTTGLDPGYDGGRFSGDKNSFAIYTHLVGDKTNPVNFDIQCLPANQYDFIIPVGVNAPANTELVIRAEALNLPTGVPVYLEDRFTGTLTSLSKPGSYYTVKLSAQSQGTGRFYLHTQNSVTENRSFLSDTDFIIIPRPQVNSIHIIGHFDNDSHISVYDITGRKLMSRKLNSSETNDVEMEGIKNGIYVVYISSIAHRSSKKMSWIRN